MDNEKLKQFIVPILIVVVALIMTIYIGMKLANNIQNIIGYKNDIAAKEQLLAEKKAQLDKYIKEEAAEAKKTAEEASKSKPFYKPAASGMNTEAIIQGEFTEILQLIRANKIKVRTIKYEYDPQDDAFVKGGTTFEKGLNYNTEEDFELNGGERNFIVKEIEVYEVIPQ